MVQVVGLISDTHGVLLPEALQALSASTGTIIHAGDIGEPRYRNRLKASSLIQELEAGTGSTVMAITGNVDDHCPATRALYPPYRVLTLAGKKFLVIHICGVPPIANQAAAGLIAIEQPNVVVFGHSHVPGVYLHEGIIYINPGSAGPSRFQLPQCVAILTIGRRSLSVKFVSLNLKERQAKLPEDFSIPLDVQHDCNM